MNFLRKENGCAYFEMHLHRGSVYFNLLGLEWVKEVLAGEESLMGESHNFGSPFSRGELVSMKFRPP